MTNIDSRGKTLEQATTDASKPRPSPVQLRALLSMGTAPAVLELRTYRAGEGVVITIATMAGLERRRWVERICEGPLTFRLTPCGLRAAGLPVNLCDAVADPFAPEPTESCKPVVKPRRATFDVATIGGGRGERTGYVLGRWACHRERYAWAFTHIATGVKVSAGWHETKPAALARLVELDRDGLESWQEERLVGGAWGLGM